MATIGATLRDLVAEAKRFPMTDEQRQQQRLSFAYGNCAIDNPLVTRQVVQDAADREISADDRLPHGGL